MDEEKYTRKRTHYHTTSYKQTSGMNTSERKNKKENKIVTQKWKPPEENQDKDVLKDYNL